MTNEGLHIICFQSCLCGSCLQAGHTSLLLHILYFKLLILGFNHRILIQMRIYIAGKSVCEHQWRCFFVITAWNSLQIFPKCVVITTEACAYLTLWFFPTELMLTSCFRRCPLGVIILSVINTDQTSACSIPPPWYVVVFFKIYFYFRSI